MQKQRQEEGESRLTSLAMPVRLISTGPGSIGTLSLFLDSHSFTQTYRRSDLVLYLGSNVILIEEPADNLAEYVSPLAWRAYHR